MLTMQDMVSSILVNAPNGFTLFTHDKNFEIFLGNYASDSYPPPSARYAGNEASYIAALSAGKNDFF